MALQILTINLTEDMCPLSTFKKVRESQGDAFFFESASAIGEPALVSVIGLGRFQRLVGPIFQALRKYDINAAAKHLQLRFHHVGECQQWGVSAIGRNQLLKELLERHQKNRSNQMRKKNCTG